ncbi:MAG: hypothetical protein ABEJ65_13025, partial [bacterium]
SYISDTYCRIALSTNSREDVSLESIAEDLRSPSFLPYVGRRAFPLGLPLNPQLQDNLDLGCFGDYELSPPAKKVVDNISGRLRLSTEVPEEFDCEFRETSLRDDRVPGGRRFRRRMEWFTEVDESVL